MREVNRIGMFVAVFILMGLVAEAKDSGLVREARRTVTPPKIQDATGDPSQETRLEVAMGEWTVNLEKDAVRPGIITFVIRNEGKKTHGLRIRSAGPIHDRFEMRAALMPPGGTASLTVRLAAGSYRVDCYVEEPGVGDHGKMGVGATLTVRTDASPDGER